MLPMTTDAGRENIDAGGANDEPKALDIAALLADEAAGDTAITVKDLKPFLEQHTGSIIERVTSDLTARQQRESQERQSVEERNASAAEDVKFATDLEANLRSPDEATRTTAQKTIDENSQRYRRGLALGWERDSSEASVRAVGTYLEPIWNGVREAGHEALIEAFKDRDLMARHKGNWMLAAIEYADTRGFERGKVEAAETADRDRRTDEGAQNSPALGAGNRTDANADLWEGIDRSKPGAGDEYLNRVNARNAKNLAARR